MTQESRVLDMREDKYLDEPLGREKNPKPTSVPETWGLYRINCLLSRMATGEDSSQ